MASIIATSIDLTKIPKDKLSKVKKVNTYLLLLQLMMSQISSATTVLLLYNKLRTSVMLNKIRFI